MIAYIDGGARMVCDWCFARGEKGPDRDIPVRPKRWGVGKRGGKTHHACPRHTRDLRAWERGDD